VNGSAQVDQRSHQATGSFQGKSKAIRYGYADLRSESFEKGEQGQHTDKTTSGSCVDFGQDEEKARVEFTAQKVNPENEAH
jgi:hypothetical protein